MKYLLANLILITSFSAIAFTGGGGTKPPLDTVKWKEADYVNHYCEGKIEHYIPNNGWIDCLTETHAIEYDFSYKWREAPGQALFYSAMTGKKPGIVLIIDPEDNGRYLKRLETTINEIPCKPSQCPAIKVWTIEKH